jgi:outer membrane receptor protein involved in Fe transport
LGAKFNRCWHVVLLGLVLDASPVLGQSRATSGDLTGVITDESQAVLPGVTITAIQVDTNFERVVVSEADGRFDVPALPPGTYRVRAELPGFSPRVFDGVELRLGSRISLDITLQLAGVQEQITVAAESPLLNVQQAVLANVVTSPQIERLPINGRSFISFSLITPGVTADRMPLQGASATSGLAFGGQRARSNNVMVDGLDNNDDTVGSVRATFSQEAVREFQVMAQSYSAEFGKASSAVINIVTKSGTNTLTGALFGYFRDDALNAKEYFERYDPSGAPISRPKAPYSQQQFGLTMSGPLKRNATFFFGSFERLDVGASNFVTIDDTTPVAVPGRPPRTAAQILRDGGFAIETGHVPFSVTSNQFIAKLDRVLRGGHTLTFRYNYANGFNENTESWGGNVARSRGAALDNRDHMFAAAYQGVLSQRALNELRFQVADRNQTVLPLDPTCLGPCDRNDEGGPTIEIGGVASLGRHRVNPQLRRSRRYQLLDTLSYQTGAHLLKGGIDVNIIENRSATLPLHFGGRYIFTPLPAIPGLLPSPISAIQAFALGLPAAYVQGYGNDQTSYTTSDLAVFAQDGWRLNERLTMQMGVRYQRQYWPERVYRVSGASEYGIRSDSNNLAPRLGLNWDVPGASATSVHAAYGAYYDNIITASMGVADLINGQPDGVRTLVARFPQSIAGWNVPGRRLPEGALGPFPSLVISIDPNLQSSYAHQVSAGVDRAIGQTTVSANVAYIRGLKQLGSIDYNPVVVSLGAGRRPEDVAGRAGTSASILQYTSFGDTWYRGLTLSVRRRFSGRSQFLASYVLSKAEDTSSDFQTSFLPENNGVGRDPNNPGGLPVGFDPADERGPSQQDQRHRFVLSGWYEMPGSIQLSGIVTVGSGVPFNILAGTDLNGDGDGGNFPSDRAWRSPGEPTSSVSRNAGRLPSEAILDLRVSRRFALGGRVSIEPILEVFNLLNRFNFTDINNVFGVGAYPNAPMPTYGQFLRAAPPRQAQIAARLLF